MAERVIVAGVDIGANTSRSRETVRARPCFARSCVPVRDVELVGQALPERGREAREDISVLRGDELSDAACGGGGEEGGLREADGGHHGFVGEEFGQGGEGAFEVGEAEGEVRCVG